MVMVYILVLLLNYCHVIKQRIGFLFLLKWRQQGFGRKKITLNIRQHRHFSKKPDWAPNEIIRMKALMPELGCRKLADSFNRRFAKAKQITVGKTYVNGIIQQHQYEIQVLKKNIKHRKPLPLPLSLVWGLDLTGKTRHKGRCKTSLASSNMLQGLICV